MKKQFLVGMTLLSSAFISNSLAASKTLPNYDQLQQAVNQGDNVAAVVFMDKCQLKESGNQKSVKLAAEETSTRINFNIFSHYKVIVEGQEKFTIAASNTILTEHRSFGPVYAYGRLRIFNDNSAEYHTAYYDPRTYELKSSGDYVCHISNGNDQNSILLFDQSV